MLSWTADRYPGRKAVGGAQPLTYRQWDARINQLARALAGLGVRAGDRVAFLLADGEPMASLHLAVQKLGAASVSLSVRFGPAELAYCIGDADPMLVIGDETTQASLSAPWANLRRTGPPWSSSPGMNRTAGWAKARAPKTSASSFTPRAPPAAASRPPRWARSCAASSRTAATSRWPRPGHDR